MSENKAVTVLLVEDQEGLAQAYAAVLGAHYDVRTATSGKEALELVDGTVDVILLDRRMPGMSGDEVLEAMIEEGVDAKIAMLTAVEPTGDILEMPCDDYVTKPIDNVELVELVDRLHTRNQYSDETQHLFRLGAKKVALETADKHRSSEYDDLVAEMQAIHDEIDEPVDQLDDAYRRYGLDRFE